MATLRSRRNAPVAIVTSNHHGVIAQANHFACDLFGYEPQTLIGQNVDILMLSPFREQHQSYIERYMQNGVMNFLNTTREVEAVTREGQVITMSLTLSQVGDRDSGCFFLATFTPVKEQIATIMINGEGLIEEVNERCCAMFGYASNEVVGKPIMILMPEAHAAKHQGHISTYMRTRKKRTLERTRNVSCKHKDGTIFPVALCVHEVVSIQGGTRFLGEMTPVAELDATLTLKLDGTIVAASRKTSLLYGYSQAELLSMNIKSILMRLPNLTEEELNGYHSVMARHKDGSRFKALISLKTFKDRNNQETLLSCQVSRDHTEVSDVLKQEEDDNDVLGKKYEMKRVLASGGFGQVILARDMSVGREVAIKCIDKSSIARSAFCYNDELGRYIPIEIAIHRMLIHPNIVKCFDVIETSLRFYVAMEYGEGGDLSTRVKKYDQLSESLGRHVLKQVIAALVYCHSLGICHRDVKPENIVFTGNEEDHPLRCWQVKLVDFGLAAFISPGDTFNEFAGTAVFAAPEVLLGREYEADRVEMWSLGVVLYFMLNGKLPFDTLDKAVRGEVSPSRPVSNECQELFVSLFSVDPSKRPKLNELLDGPWFLSDDDQLSWDGSEIIGESNASGFFSNQSSPRRSDLSASDFNLTESVFSPHGNVAPSQNSLTSDGQSPRPRTEYGDQSPGRLRWDCSPPTPSMVQPKVQMMNHLRAASSRAELVQRVTALTAKMDLSHCRSSEALLKLGEMMMEFIPTSVLESMFFDVAMEQVVSAASFTVVEPAVQEEPVNLSVNIDMDY